MTSVSPALPGNTALQIRLAANEMAKGVRLMWRRRALVVTFVLMNAVLYMGISLFIGGGHLIRPLLTLTLPALLSGTVAIVAALQGSGGIAEEVNGGTLELTQLSPASPEVQVLGRLGALAVEGLAAAAALGVVFYFSLGLHYAPHLDVLAPAILTVLDALGFGLVVVALTVRIASIGAITHVFNMAVTFFGGTMVPVALFPHGLEIFARFMPTTLGVEALDATLTGGSLPAVWDSGVLPWLLAHAAVSLALGWALYSVAVRRARREGGLSPR
ncbi:MAG TPA: ABC transporter permease [Streptosporangiaceae bacterium]|jgi:ABC-2 type transport system permease protein